MMAKAKDKYVPDYLNTDLTIVDGQVVPTNPVNTKKDDDNVKRMKGAFDGQFAKVFVKALTGSDEKGG